MSTLQPYYYNYTVSGPDYVGYPNEDGAIFSVYGNWGFFPIFRNDNPFPIKLNSLTFGASIYNGSAKGALFFANLDNSLTQSARVSCQSAAFDIPMGSRCQSITIAPTTNIVVKPNSYFLFGIKVNRTSRNRSFINIACTRISKDLNPWYTSKELTSGLGETFTTYRVDPSRAHWSKRLPYMQVDYTPYNTAPIPGKNSVTINQGPDNYVDVSISGYGNWSVKSFSSSHFTSCSKVNNSTLRIRSKWFNSANNTKDNITLQNADGSKTTNIVVETIMPRVNSCLPERNYIRPTESVKISGSTSDNLVPLISSIDLSDSDSPEGLISFNQSNKTINVGNITTSGLSGWAGNIIGTCNITIVMCHPHNTLVTKRFDNIIVARHFTENDINVSLSSYAITNVVGNTLTLYDNSNIYGGCEFLIYDDDSYFTYNTSTNKLTIKSPIPQSVISITRPVYIVNDFIVQKNINIDILSQLSVLPNDNEDNPLPLFVYYNDDNGKYNISPYNYPIKLMSYPNTDPNKGEYLQPPIDIPGSKTSILITNLKFGCNESDVPIDSSLSNNNYWAVDLIKNIDLANKRDYYVILSLPKLELNDSNLPDDLTMDSLTGFWITFDVKYKLSSFEENKEINVKIYFDKYLNRIKPLETNTYLCGDMIPGSHFKLPKPYVSNDSAYVSPEYDYDCAINQLTEPAKNVISVYFGDLINVSNIISASEGGLVSNSTDKHTIETILSNMQSLCSSAGEDTSIRILRNVRPNILLNYPIMWDDSLSNIGIAYYNFTMSPWKELYLTLKNIQYIDTYDIYYNQNGVYRRVVYLDSQTNINDLTMRG